MRAPNSISRWNWSWGLFMAAIGLKHLVVVRQLEGALHHNVELRFALSSLAIMLVAGAFVRSFSGRAQVAAALAASVSTSALSSAISSTIARSVRSPRRASSAS